MAGVFLGMDKHTQTHVVAAPFFLSLLQQEPMPGDLSTRLELATKTAREYFDKQLNKDHKKVELKRIVTEACNTLEPHALMYVTQTEMVAILCFMSENADGEKTTADAGTEDIQCGPDIPFGADWRELQAQSVLLAGIGGNNYYADSPDSVSPDLAKDMFSIGKQVANGYGVSGSRAVAYGNVITHGYLGPFEQFYPPPNMSQSTALGSLPMLRHLKRARDLEVVQSTRGHVDKIDLSIRSIIKALPRRDRVQWMKRTMQWDDAVQT